MTQAVKLKKIILVSERLSGKYPKDFVLRDSLDRLKKGFLKEKHKSGGCV